MLEVQYLWLKDTLPSFWWDTNTHISCCTYKDLLFTDANQTSFKRKLPLSLEEFTSHVASHAKHIREALSEHWLMSVGKILDNFISSLPDGGLIVKESSAATKSMQQDPGGGGNNTAKISPSNLLTNRMGVEGLNATQKKDKFGMKAKNKILHVVIV
jgi:hypothetical protein